MKGTLVAATAAVLASGAVIAVYHHVVVRPALSIGVVDMSVVYRATEEEFGVLLESVSGDEGRQRALRFAQAYADRVGAALEQLSVDCNCLLVARGALAAASPRALDLTPVLLSRVRIDEMERR